ncbi:MAG: hypothetical protein RL755_1084 [Pseudomonadota bacterium]|jgi:PAS domain S-box-containing protein
MTASLSIDDLLDAINETAIISETDINGKIIFINDKFCNISGFDIKELLGKPHSIIRSEMHPPEFFSRMWETLKREENWHGDLCNRKKNGDFYWVNTTIIPVFSNKEGKTMRYVAVGFDITDKKRIERELQLRNKEFDSFLATTNGFCKLNLDGYFLDIGDSFYTMTGYSEKELRKMTLIDLEVLSPDKTKNIWMEIQKTSKGTKKVLKSFETDFKHKDGKIQPIEIIATYNHPSRHYFVLMRDISERKHKEIEQNNTYKQLHHLQKLESLGRLTAGIAHDFNNILSSVIGFNDLSKLAADDLPDDNTLKEEFIYNAMQIENASKRAAILIDQMLTYCRQEVETSTSVLELQPVLEKIYGMMRGVIPKNIAIKTVLSPEIFINLDETELYQIVVNLFVNARDAIEKPQGEIILSLNTKNSVSAQRCSACETVIQGNFVEIAVADNGCGLKAEKISRIFDPFFTTKEVGKGTGLGLSVASGIIHKAGGHIIVSSTLNQGTTFQLLFPPQKNS